MDRPIEEILRDLEELLGTEGGRLYGSWHSLGDAAFVLQRNADDILRIEEEVNKSPEAIREVGDQENREKMDFLLSDLTRRLHNFVASAVTMERHTDRHLNTHYKHNPLSSNYRAKREEIYEDEPLCHLVNAIRNVSEHYGLPEIRAEFAVGPLEQGQAPLPTVSFVLDCVQMHALIHATSRNRQYREALKFLKDNIPQFPLCQLVKRHRAAFVALLDWLQQESKWEDDEEVKEFVARYNDLAREFILE